MAWGAGHVRHLASHLAEFLSIGIVCIWGLAVMGISVVSQGVKTTTEGYLWPPCVWWWVGTSTGDGEPLALHSELEPI